MRQIFIFVIHFFLLGASVAVLDKFKQQLKQQQQKKNILHRNGKP